MRERSEISRREFLHHLSVAAGAFTVGLPLEQELQGEKAQRPETYHGNEPYFGNDIILTIDDCFYFGHTRAMFELIKDVDGTATFFPNTSNIKADHESIQLWQDIYQSGFEIGYHTTGHQKELSKKQLTDDFVIFQDKMKLVLDDTDFTIQLARAPYGDWSTDWMAFTKEQKLTNVKWNFVPNANQTDLSYFKGVLHNDNGGRITLMHPRSFDEKWLTHNISEMNEIAERDGGKISKVINSH
jgi:peptidoglycan/xylan/chitin deacetylase (PgdA/CDA1 family)